MSGEDDDFARALGDVRRIRDRDKRRPDPPPRARARAASQVRFVVEEEGDDVSFRREDVPRRQLVDLRAGRVPVDRELDLHGLQARDARKSLLDGLGRAQREGDRCVLVIHGAGHHSEDGPVLKRKLPGWLREGPLASEVLALATAPRKLGGPGASLVLLRRPRD